MEEKERVLNVKKVNTCIPFLMNAVRVMDEYIHSKYVSDIRGTKVRVPSFG
jgi:hypothetical protein